MGIVPRFNLRLQSQKLRAVECDISIFQGIAI